MRMYSLGRSSILVSSCDSELIQEGTFSDRYSKHFTVSLDMMYSVPVRGRKGRLMLLAKEEKKAKVFQMQATIAK